MPIGATISAVGAIGAAGIGAYGANKAAGKQAAALQAAQAQAQANLSPYMNFGKSAMSSLSDLYGLGPNGAGGIPDAFNKFTQLPAYQFPLQQGMLALTRKLNAEGRNMSGAELRETTQFGEGLASQYMMQNYVNPLTQFAQLGGNAAAGLTTANSNLAGQIGTAQASGVMGMTNALAGGVNNASSNLALYSMMGRNPSSYASGGNMVQAPSPNGGGLSPMYT